MTIRANMETVRHIDNILSKKVPVKLGQNKRNELIRLVYEISKGQDLEAEDVLSEIGLEEMIEDGKGGLFHRIKEALLAERYPSTPAGGDPRIMPVVMDDSSVECRSWDLTLDPKRIFIERAALAEEWTGDFTKKFPGAENIHIDSLSDVAGYLPDDDPVTLYNARRENVIITRAKSSFIKKCPCSKGCVRCGYWILNLGFGCPIDCSYCYLQMYSNAPGIMLPANLEDYGESIRKFENGLIGRTRIGTGEFTDSFALDRYTEYSRYLIPLFRGTDRSVLELKTKVADISNVLEEEPHRNVVISWSLNTERMAGICEKGGAGIDERIDAALRAAVRGYSVGFHLDPVVYYDDWEDDYEELINRVLSHDEIRSKVAWISLGTLRYTPGLKQIAERRFPDNLIFYQGEFFLDEDGKLRYPRELRTEMYNKVIRWIRSFNKKCWIYLCMELESVWKRTDLDRFSY